MSNPSLGLITELGTPATDYSEVPEAKYLLPPLPDTVLRPSETPNEELILSEYDDVIAAPRYHPSPGLSTPPRRPPQRPAQMNTPSTPKQTSSAQLETPHSTSVMSPTSSPFDHHHTPQSNSSVTRASTASANAQKITSSPFSPVIPVDERFGMSLAEPEVSHTPSSPIEKLRYYEMCQRAQDQELEKTYLSMKKSGWMSERDITQLRKAKLENWKRWEAKVKAARREVTSLKETNIERFDCSGKSSYGNGSPTGDRVRGLGISSEE